MKINFSIESRSIFLITFLILNFQFLIFNSLSAQAPDSWTQRANFPGTARTGAVGFTIGSKGYVGTGQDASLNLLNDFWEYNPATNSWTQLANFGGSPRSSAVGFSIGGKGYIGSGFDGTNNLKDFWEYDTLAGTWTRKRDLGGAINSNPRREATSFVLSNKGYVVTGYDGTTFYNKECWQFDGDTTWIKKTDVGTGMQNSYRRRATGFAIDTNGYVGCGYNYSHDWKRDFWKYNLATNTWTQKANFGGSGRGSTIEFSLHGMAYAGAGNNEYFLNDFWKYDPALNTWLQVADYSGGKMSDGISFAIGSGGYAGLGRDSVNFRNDFWIYTPDSTVGINDHHVKTDGVAVFPNPFQELSILNINTDDFYSAKFTLILHDANGKKQREDIIAKNPSVIERKNLSPGIYFYSILKNDQRYFTGKMMIE